MNKKPSLFISHSSTDQNLALILQMQLAIVLDISPTQVFCSTNPEAIPIGSDWFQEINQALDSSDVLIVIVSPSSLQSIWVGYEIGYFWHRKGNQTKIYPLVVPETTLSGPVEQLQCKSLVHETNIRAFLNELCIETGIGYPERADIRLIVDSARDVVADSHKQKLMDYLNFEYEPGNYINYPKLNRELNLPPGTSEKYFPSIAPDWIWDETRRNSAGTALYPPPSPSNPPGDPF